MRIDYQDYQIGRARGLYQFISENEGGGKLRHKLPNSTSLWKKTTAGDSMMEQPQPLTAAQSMTERMEPKREPINRKRERELQLRG